MSAWHTWPICSKCGEKKHHVVETDPAGENHDYFMCPCALPKSMSCDDIIVNTETGERYEVASTSSHWRSKWTCGHEAQGEGEAPTRCPECAHVVGRLDAAPSKR